MAGGKGDSVPLNNIKGGAAVAFDGTLKFDTAIDKTGFKLGLDSLGSLASKGMAAVTAAVTAAAGAVSALGGYAVSVGKDFESSMAQVIATMGITKDTVVDGVNSYDLLKEAAAAAGESTVFSASEAAGALNYLALAGYDAAKAADALPAVLDLAAAGGLDLAYASDLATDAMAALGIEATSENLTRFGDEMAKTASKANTSVAQLGEATLTVGGTAKSLAGGTMELNAALGVLANRGIKGAEGGTALRNMILALSAPTDKAAEAMANLGLEVFDASGNMRPMNEIFRDLDSALAGMNEGEKTQVLSDIFNKVDLKFAQAMLAGCGEEFDALTDALSDCDGAMSQMADTMNDTLDGDLKSLNSKIEAFGTAIYDNLNDPLRELAQLGGEYISQLTAAFKEGGFEGLAESLGDVLGQAITKMSEYLPMIIDMGAAVVRNLIDGLLSNLDIISESASQILTTIVNCAVDIIPDVLAAGMEMISSLAQGIAESAPQLADAAISGINQLISGIAENLPAIVEAGIFIISSIAGALQNNLPELKNSAKELITSLAEMIKNNLPTLIQAAVSIISSIASALADNTEVILDAALQVLEILAVSLIENISPLIDAALQIIIAISEYIANNAGEITKIIITIVETIVSCLIENAPKILAAAVILLSGIIQAVPQILVELLAELGRLGGAALDWLSDVGSQALEAVGDWLSDTLDSAVQGAEDIIEGIMEFFSELPGNIADTLSDALDNVCGWADDMCDTAKETAEDFLDGIMDFLNELPENISDSLLDALEAVKEWASDLMEKGRNAAKDLVDAVVTGVMSLPEKLKDIGKQLVEGLWEGIKSAAGWLKDKVCDFGDDVVDGFKDVFGIHSPSRVMRDSVGKYLAQGVGVGFTEELPDVGKEALKTFASTEFIPDISKNTGKYFANVNFDIDPGAIRVLEHQGTGMNEIIHPSPTSEITNNQYSYNTVNNNTSGEPDGSSGNIQIFIDKEMIADIDMDKIDKKQGEKIQLRKRGLAW